MTDFPSTPESMNPADAARYEALVRGAAGATNQGRVDGGGRSGLTADDASVSVGRMKSKRKHPGAVALGKASAASLTPQQRTARARKAAKARWDKHRRNRG